MDAPPPIQRKPLFSSIALGCMLVAALLLWLAGDRVDAGATLDGYSSFAVMVSFMVALALSGLITGQIALVRGERPIALPILALFLNAVVFILVIIHIPR